MESLSKLDLIASGAILIMFVGAYTLTLSRFGLILIIASVLVMLFILLRALREPS